MKTSSYYQSIHLLQCIVAFIFFISFASLNASPKSTLHSSSHKPFVIFSPPKCGTHLVGKALSLMVNENPAYYLTSMGDNSVLDGLNIIASEEAQGSFVVSHHFTNALLKKLVHKGYKIFFVIRDPRDQLISAMNWLKEGQWYWLPISKISNPHDQITEAITGDIHGWQCVESCFLSFEDMLSRLSSKSVYNVHFEKLVGINGKGSDEEQAQEILAIANHIGLTISNEKLKYVADHLFGGTKTFRDGSIGKWKLLFTPEQKKEFRVRYSYLLRRLGYEKNSRW